jgi:hypothetical protein
MIFSVSGRCCWFVGIHRQVECKFTFIILGGSGNSGRVADVRGWSSESDKSVVSVRWPNGTSNVYRVGHNGKVDLRYVTDAVGGTYYREHLPVLGTLLTCMLTRNIMIL